MWVVWCLGTLVVMCLLLLSMAEKPPAKRGIATFKTRTGWNRFRRVRVELRVGRSLRRALASVLA